ncbi:hypothetical protein G7Y89_g14331 [Cudoniella acicularis]|uniref:Uncharacterized protein n=1 Tax=Cudoniella acicularis TaxID=354080 RepID=A0A8H4R3C2_9HELO|nr:hypothetical protein G7Y89_g14331 [Cudoniella acicularis]
MESESPTSEEGGINPMANHEPTQEQRDAEAYFDTLLFGSTNSATASLAEPPPHYDHVIPFEPDGRGGYNNVFVTVAEVETDGSAYEMSVLDPEPLKEQTESGEAEETGEGVEEMAGEAVEEAQKPFETLLFSPTPSPDAQHDNGRPFKGENPIRNDINERPVEMDDSTKESNKGASRGYFEPLLFSPTPSPTAEKYNPFENENRNYNNDNVMAAEAGYCTTGTDESGNSLKPMLSPRPADQNRWSWGDPSHNYDPCGNLPLHVQAGPPHSTAILTQWDGNPLEFDIYENLDDDAEDESCLDEPKGDLPKRILSPITELPETPQNDQNPFESDNNSGGTIQDVDTERQNNRIVSPEPFPNLTRPLQESDRIRLGSHDTSGGTARDSQVKKENPPDESDHKHLGNHGTAGGMVKDTEVKKRNNALRSPSPLLNPTCSPSESENNSLQSDGTKERMVQKAVKRQRKGFIACRGRNWRPIAAAPIKNIRMSIASFNFCKH